MDSDKTQTQPPQDTTPPSTIVEGEETPKSGEQIELTPEYRPEISHEGAAKEPDETEEFQAGYAPERSTRQQRVLTERGLEYQQQLRARSLRSTIIRWRRKLDEAEDLVVDSEDPWVLTRERDELSAILREVQTAAASLSEVAVVEEPIDHYEEETRKLRKRLNNKINDLKEEIRSITSRKSIVSRKSKMSSRRSHSSSRLSTTLKARSSSKDSRTIGSDAVSQRGGCSF